MEKISTKEVYSAIVQLVIHAESISWNRFHSFLIANSILVLAWVAIYVSSTRSLIVTCILLAICVLGILSGLFWAALGKRGRRFVDGYLALGTEIEADPMCWPKELEKGKPLTKSGDLRDTLPYGWSGSRYLLKLGPLSFMILYIVLLVASLIR